jgi:two-component system chemotaxis response regulator CheV
MDHSNNLALLDRFEIGGSVFEMIEFSLIRDLPDGRTMKGLYGVNVAKVREVVRMPRINPLASRIPGIAGVFELRGVPIPAIHLNHVLGDHTSAITLEQQIIVTEFSQKRAGFIVNQTHRIRRVEWSKVLPPPADSASNMSGMILVENHDFLFIIDLERILVSLENGGGSGHHAPASPSSDLRAHSAVTPVTDPRAPGILVVDDSSLVRNNLRQVLYREGFRVLEAENGSAALKKLEDLAAGLDKRFGKLNAVVTDVEMPLMDGLTLATRIREHPSLGSIPIVLHTSLIGPQTAEAAKHVGANAYVVKNDTKALVEILREILTELPFALGA